MIFELILLFLAICSLSNSTLSILFLTAAAVSTIVRAQQAGKDSTRLRAELEALKANIQGEIEPLRRQLQYLSQQLATLEPTKRPEPEIRRQPGTPADTAVAAKPAEPVHAAPPGKPAEVVETVNFVPFTPAPETTSSAHHVPAVPPPPLVPQPLAPPPLVPSPPLTAQAKTEPIRISASDLPESSPAAPAVPALLLAKPAPEVTLDRNEAVLPHGAPAEIQLPRAEPPPTELRPAGEKSPSPLPTPVPASSPIAPSLPAAPSETVPQRPPTPPPPRREVPIAARVPSATVRQPASTASFTRRPEAAAPPAPHVHRRSLLEWLTWLLKFEERLGADWAAKIGIVLLVFGLTLLGLYEFKNMPNWGKVAIFYALSGGLLGAGVFAERRERYKILGRTAIGGGWALFFFTTFAMQYVFAMQVLHNLVLDSILLLAVAAAMVFHTLRYRSQVVTGFAFLLAYSTIVLSQNAAHSQRTEVVFYSLGAGVILTLGIVVFAGRMRWFELEVFGVLSSYLAHFYWLYSLLGLRGAQGKMFPEFYPSAIILLSYWVIYRASYLLRNIRSPYEEVVSSIAAVLNTGLLLAAMRFQSAHPDLAFFALLALGALEFVLGQLPLTRKRRIAFILLTVLGTSLMVAAVPFRYAAEPGKVALLWLVAAEVFLVVGVVAREVVFRRLGKVIAVAVCIHMTWYALPELLRHGYPIHPIEPGILGEGVVFLIAGIAFQVNYFFAASRGKSYFTEKIDMLLAQFLSYAGSAALAVGLWAVLTPPWTLVAWTALMAALAFGGRRFAAKDASLQAGIVGVGGFLWALFVRTFVASHDLATEHLYFTVIPFVLAAVFFYATAWQIWSANASRQAIARCLATWAGTLLLWILISNKVAEGWRVAALLLLATALAEAGARLQYRPLVWQVHALAAWALFLGFFKGYANLLAWHGIESRFLTPILTAALIYWLAKRTGDIQRARAALVRDLYTWAGTAVVAVLIGREAPPLWMACQWLGYGIVLALIGRRSKLASLWYQECALAAVAIYQAIWMFGRPDTRYGHVSAQLLTVSLVTAGLYSVSRFSSTVQDVENDGSTEGKVALWIAHAHTWAALLLLTLLAWYEVPQHAHGWFPAIVALFAVVLAVLDRKLKAGEFGWQGQVLGAVAFVSAAVVDLPLADKFHGVSIRLLASLTVLAVLYGLSVILRPEVRPKTELKYVYSWAALLLGCALAWSELQPRHPEWIAVAWLGYGIVLTLVGRRFKRPDLCWQEVILAAASIAGLLAFNFNDGLSGSIGPVSIRLVTVGLVAAGLYFASRRCYLEETETNRWIAYAHTWAATTALAVLCYKDAPADSWLPAMLAAFALLLALADRFWKTAELKWQAHALSAAALALVAGNNIPQLGIARAKANGRVTGLLPAFMASLIVDLCFYLLSPLLRFSEEQRRRNFHHIYTWPASVLAAALIWYGVNETGVAIGWALLGVVLFWTGVHYKITHLRLQAYVALCSAFARIFFVDLTEMPLTVAMIAAILYFVHATLRSESELSANTSIEGRLKVGGILAYLGTAAVGALCYYQFHKELAPIAWAVMVLLLLAAALWLHNFVYLHQAMLGTVGIFCYGVAYNLNRAWRITPLVFAIAILLLGLPLAYPLRRIGAAASSSNRLARIAKAFVHRPEQVLFFSAIVLLTFTMTRWAQGLITLGWGVEGIFVYVIALLKKESTFRYTGWALVLLSLGKLVTHDAWIGTSPLTRILTVIAVALAWLLVAFFHSRYGEKFKEWI